MLRSNCIDCLDRTNVAQFAFGLVALGRQLEALGVADAPRLDPRSSIAAQLVDLYEAAGNTLARQVTQPRSYPCLCVHIGMASKMLQGHVSQLVI